MAKTLLAKFFLLLACIALTLILISLWGLYSAIRPVGKTTSLLTPHDFQVEFEAVTLKTSDNVTLDAWFIPNANPKAKAIIVLHGYPDNKASLLSSRLFLHKDYHLLFLDFRYLGKSGGNYSTIGGKEVFDLLAAVDFLTHRGINDIGIWGFSMGAAVALMSAEQAPQIKAIVAESSYANLEDMLRQYYPISLLNIPLIRLTQLWAQLFLGVDIQHVSPANAAARLEIPVLLIHSTLDKVVPFEQAQTLQHALEGNPLSTHLFIETSHGELTAPIRQTINSFFKRNL